MEELFKNLAVDFAKTAEKFFKGVVEVLEKQDEPAPENKDEAKS